MWSFPPLKFDLKRPNCHDTLTERNLINHKRTTEMSGMATDTNNTTYTAALKTPRKPRFASQHAEFLALVREVVACDAPTTIASDDWYDSQLAKFLALSASASSEKKMHWFLMRAGIRDTINYLNASDRAKLKAPPAKSDYRQERDRAYKAAAKQRRQEDEAYAKEYNIPLSDVGLHRVNNGPNSFPVVMQRLEDAVREEAARRAERILDTWLCDGVTPLRSCTGADLARLAAKEDALAQGHAQNRAFYNALRTKVAPDKTVGACFSAEEFLTTFDAVFSSERPHK